MQVKYSILDRNAETDGTLACCRDLGIAVIAHSPLQQGLLTEHALQAGDSATKQQQQVRQPCICKSLLKFGTGRLDVRQDIRQTHLVLSCL